MFYLSRFEIHPVFFASIHWAFAMFWALSCRAEVVLSGVLDYRVTTTITSLDIDDDGIDDLEFYGDQEALANGQYLLRVRTLGNIYVWCLNVPVDHNQYVSVFTTTLKGSNINESMDGLNDPQGDVTLYSWQSGTIKFHGFEIAGGIPGNDSYLPIRFIKNQQTYYGWVRLIFPSSYDHYNETGYVKIKESGYESQQAVPLDAGAGTTSMPLDFRSGCLKEDLDQLSIFVNNVRGLFCILQESSDLVSWRTILNKVAAQDLLTHKVLVESDNKFYRWKLSENLETTN